MKKNQTDLEKRVFRIEMILYVLSGLNIIDKTPLLINAINLIFG